MKVRLIIGDITKLLFQADAIVNAANKTLLGGGGVDGAIHEAAGPELLKECRALNGCETGKAKVTKAYRLPNKYIIHTVGPIYGIDPNEDEQLANCYLNCLRLADSLGLKTIVFPSISTGVYGYPVDEAAKVVAKVFATYRSCSIEAVTMCVFGKSSPNEDFATYQSAFQAEGLL